MAGRLTQAEEREGRLLQETALGREEGHVRRPQRSRCPMQPMRSRRWLSAIPRTTFGHRRSRQRDRICERDHLVARDRHQPVAVASHRYCDRAAAVVGNRGFVGRAAGRLHGCPGLDDLLDVASERGYRGGAPYRSRTDPWSHPPRPPVVHHRFLSSMRPLRRARMAWKCPLTPKSRAS